MQQVFHPPSDSRISLCDWLVCAAMEIDGRRPGPRGQYYWGQGTEVVKNCDGLGEEGAPSSPSPWPPGGGRGEYGRGGSTSENTALS